MKFKIYTLGCKVNTYESNVIKEHMEDNNYVNVDSKEYSDVIIINTCTVTNTADKKSFKIINKAAREKPQVLIVIGCMSQIKADELALNSDISIIIGNKYKNLIPNLINDYLTFNKQIIKVEDIMDIPFESMSLKNFDRTRAFVKIQDGCNNFCSYCIIPYSRGNIRSKHFLDVIGEIKSLIKMGHSEIVLTGIHTGHYGEDLKNYNFHNLLNDILKINGLERLRISSIEMNEITDDIIKLIKNNNILVDHMHIPLQSGSNTVLKDMNRKYNKEEFISKINELRSVRPNMSITTDLIVGYPTETEELFLETVETIKTIKFSNIHVFPYSSRVGTESSKLVDLDESIKKERVKKIMEISKQLEIEYMNKFVGSEVDFIPETYRNEMLIGHSGNYLLIKVNDKDKYLKQSVKVKIESINYPYCIASIIN